MPPSAESELTASFLCMVRALSQHGDRSPPSHADVQAASEDDPQQFEVFHGACRRLSPSRDVPISMRKDQRALTAQAVRDKPTSDVIGTPTSLSDDGPSAADGAAARDL